MKKLLFQRIDEALKDGNKLYKRLMSQKKAGFPNAKGCSQCSMLNVNGVPTHEKDCPKAKAKCDESRHLLEAEWLKEPEYDDVTGRKSAPGVIACNRCQTPVELDSGWANECPKCHTEYNGSGQELAHRSQWGEETGEDFTNDYTDYGEVGMRESTGDLEAKLRELRRKVMSCADGSPEEKAIQDQIVKTKTTLLRLRSQEKGNTGPYSGLTKSELRQSGTSEPDWF